MSSLVNRSPPPSPPVRTDAFGGDHTATNPNSSIAETNTKVRNTANNAFLILGALLLITGGILLGIGTGAVVAAGLIFVLGGVLHIGYSVYLRCAPYFDSPDSPADPKKIEPYPHAFDNAYALDAGAKVLRHFVPENPRLGERLSNAASGAVVEAIKEIPKNSTLSEKEKAREAAKQAAIKAFTALEAPLSEKELETSKQAVLQAVRDCFGSPTRNIPLLIHPENQPV